jgi:hypothetical protein
VAPLQPLEEEPVYFYHDKHVKALKEEGCTSCHGQGSDGEFLFAYPLKRDETSRRALMNSYHDSCIGCHDGRSAAGKSSGPVTCGECHFPRDEKAWMQPAGFDDGLHYRHETAMNHRCDTCHHVFDEDKKQLAYRKGTESSCRSCHHGTTDPDMPSLKDATHYSCVNCHLGMQAAGKRTGPVACDGCHGDTGKRMIATAANVPRPDRGQEETAVLHGEHASMKSVLFKHKIHENATATCRSCHHETLDACDTCHTATGNMKGGDVTLVDAFHKKTSTRSCVGCHNAMKAEVLCAGCHDSMKDTSMDQENCSTCHNGSQERETVAKSMDKGFDLAAILPDDDIMIDVLEKDYESSTFPHAMIIRKLIDISKHNRLANTFHKDVLTTCTGCHHYSSPEQAEQPPSCGSCHTTDFNPDDSGKPRLLASYHLQCMGCHQKMRIGFTDCTSCHAPRKGTVPVSQRASEGTGDKQ